SIVPAIGATSSRACAVCLRASVLRPTIPSIPLRIRPRRMSVESTRPHSRAAVYLLLGLALALTALAYAASLRGGYVFDDFPNIVENREVHLAALNWHSLR